MKQAILITGGSGYIGLYTAVELMAAGREVFIIDNLCNSKASVLDRSERIAVRRLDFAKIDAGDLTALQPKFPAYRFDAVIHFAAMKSVGDSVEKPLARVYRTNSASSCPCKGFNLFFV